MKRRWNPWMWSGFALVLAAMLSYVPIFARYADTRDVPWVNLLLFAGGGALLGLGTKRAFAAPERYRGKIAGPVLGLLSLLIFGTFCFFTFVFSKHLPAAESALHTGQTAPDFTLASQNGNPVTLSQITKKSSAVLLVFYRGYW